MAQTRVDPSGPPKSTSLATGLTSGSSTVVNPLAPPSIRTPRRTATPAKKTTPRKPAAAPAKPPTSAPATDSVIQAIYRAADELGVPRTLALAIAKHESGLDPHAPGDHGYFRNGRFVPDPSGPPTSFGLFQLHQGGELGSLTPEQAMDPYTNAKVALTQVAAVMKAHPGADPGTIAALAQRPKDTAGYAQSVNALLKNPDALAASKGVTGSPIDPTVGAPAAGSLAAMFTPDAQLSINKYGFIAALAHTNPELKTLMAKYAKEDLSIAAVQQRLAADIQDTKWYKKTTDAQRSMQVLHAVNPTEYQHQFQTTLINVQNAANQLGVKLPGLGLHDFAANALNNGWQPDEIKKYLLAQATFKPGQGQPLTGAIGATATDIAAQARQYMVPLSPQAQEDWTSKIANGRVTLDDFTNYLKEQAKSLFPGLGFAIDAGVTPETYVDPYKQIASKTLELPAEQVNFDDPKWSKALFQVDPKTGARTSMSLADWAKTLRSDPAYGYGKTQQAKSTAADFAETILNVFGATGNYGGNG